MRQAPAGIYEADWLATPGSVGNYQERWRPCCCSSSHGKRSWFGGLCTSWIVEVTASGSLDGKPFQATHLFLTSLRTTPDAQLQLVRDRWSSEGWYWIRDTQRLEDDHRYRGFGSAAMSSLRTAPLNLQRLARFRSIRSGMQAVMHDITALLAMARRQPQPNPC